MIGLGPTLGQLPWHEKLRRTLARNQGVRLGEATVVSRQVHLCDPAQPQVVTVLSSADAGQVFYSRFQPGEIIHLDIFHAVAEVDHRRVAGALRRAFAGVMPVWDESGASLLLDFFDVVTATGGGRVTGDLSYGRKASLRAAHENHVHVAGRLPAEQLHLIVRLVGTVEEEIMAQGVEIRRVERIINARGEGTSPADLSSYTDESDSWLRGSRRPESSQSEQQSGGEGHQTLRGQRGATMSGGGESAGQSGSSEGAGSSKSRTEWDALATEQHLQLALDLSRRLGSPDEIKRALDELAREQPWPAFGNRGGAGVPYLIRQLEEEGLVRRDVRGLRLTEAGKELAIYLETHLKDVKLRFRKLVRRMPAAAARQTSQRGSCRGRPSASVRFGPIRGAAPAEAGTWLGDLAVPETLWAALKRTHLERIQAGGKVSAGLRLERSDVHVNLRTSEQPLHICLLIDASASMAGRRIQSAKHLARHLIASTRDKIAVIAFQEREVKVYVPFTRDYAMVEEGLARIQPLGLTPLAHGLTQSLDLIRASKVRRPLLLLITDGIPTVPKWTIDPLTDALEAAKLVGEGKIPFGCIGLQPSRRYLEELTRVAGGTLHVVEELNEEALVTIAHIERQKTHQR